MKQRFFGLDELDKHIAEYVTAEHGTFVELGAYDGVTQNNTLYFERKGWRGVLIEPTPSAYYACVANRPLAKVFNCACIASDDPRTEVEMTSVGLMSLVTGARGGREGELEWIERGASIQKIQHRQIMVPARTLDSVLEEACLGNIELLCLDVEGYELQVLNGLNLEKRQPEFIVCEDSYDQSIQQYLTMRNYEICSVLAEHRFVRDVLYRQC